MVRKKQTVSPEHTEVLQKWKERGFVAPDFEYEELTDHYIGQLTKVAKNLSDEEYVEGHKGEKVRMYKEMTIMMNEVQTITSKCLLLQSGQNNYSEHVRQHLLQIYSSETVMPTSKVDPLSSFQSVLFCLDNVPVTYGKEQLKDAIVKLLVTQPKKCVTELKTHLQKTTRSYKQLVLELIAQKEMKAGIFFYVAAAQLVLGEPILLIHPMEHISGTSMPYYSFNVEYCIPEDRNIPIEDFKIRLVYNGWNHFTPFFPKCVAEIIRKGEPVLRKISHTLDELKQLLQLVPKKSLLKSGLKNMIEHLEAADTVGRSCNFKFDTAETEMTEDVPLPWDDTIVTGHSRKRSLPSEKGCEPSPKKSKSETVTTATTGESSMTVTTTTTTTTTMATAPSQISTRSQTGVASTSKDDTSTAPAAKLAHRKSIKLPALQCVCGKVFENKQYLDLHIGRKHKENFSCSGKVVEGGKEYDCSFVSTDRNSMWTHFRTLHLNIWCNYCVILTCSFGHDEIAAVLKHQHDKHGMNTGLMCMKCNKVFSQSGKLKDHLLTCKNKEWPFVCEQCGQDFRQRMELNIHLKQVHPKVPGDRLGFFKCPNCTKEFRTYSGRQKHVQNCKK